jgi:GT2 family glycosyltransferase
MRSEQTFDLSVIIPTYKRKDSLFKLLNCLFEQENIALEIIIVDQNPAGFFSTEEEKHFEGIMRVLQSEPNASQARNNGFLKSSAPHLLFIDDDLVPEKDFCNKGKAIFRDFPSVQCYFPNVYTDSGIEAGITDALTKAVNGFNESLFEIRDAISAAVFFTRECYTMSGGFDPYIFEFARTAEDQEFLIRLRRKGIKLWFAPGLSVFHDERVEGGCELRTSDYWLTRERCIKSWTLRYRVHGNNDGRLMLKDMIRLSRSSFINRRVLTDGWKTIVMNIFLLRNALKTSATFYQEHKKYYLQNESFLTRNVEENK